MATNPETTTYDLNTLAGDDRVKGGSIKIDLSEEVDEAEYHIVDHGEGEIEVTFTKPPDEDPER